MDKLKQWVALTVVAVLAIGAGAWFLLVSPKRSEAADLRTQAAGVDAESSQLRTQLQVLKALAKDLPKAQADLAKVAAKIPDNPALPALIRALTKAADEAGVELVALSPGRPTAVAQAKAGAVAPQPTPAAAGGTAPVATGSTATTPARTAATTTAAAAGSLQAITLTVDVVGRYFQVEQFFDKLENLTRAFKVTEFSMKPGVSPTAKVAKDSTGTAALKPATPSTLTTTITGSVYLATGRTSTAAAPAAAAK
jgi:type IV pilus assembly protein PilO